MNARQSATIRGKGQVELGEPAEPARSVDGGRSLAVVGGDRVESGDADACRGGPGCPVAQQARSWRTAGGAIHASGRRPRQQLRQDGRVDLSFFSRC